MSVYYTDFVANESQVVGVKNQTKRLPKTKCGYKKCVDSDSSSDNDTDPSSINKNEQNGVMKKSNPKGWPNTKIGYTKLIERESSTDGDAWDSTSSSSSENNEGARGWPNTKLSFQRLVESSTTSSSPDDNLDESKSKGWPNTKIGYTKLIERESSTESDAWNSTSDENDDHNVGAKNKPKSKELLNKKCDYTTLVDSDDDNWIAKPFKVDKSIKKRVDVKSKAYWQMGYDRGFGHGKLLLPN